MSVKANYQRGDCYFYVSRHGLALRFIGLSLMKSMMRPSLPMFFERPAKGDYHRIRIEVVRTKAEAAAMNRRLAKTRKLNRARAKARLAKNAL